MRSTLKALAIITLLTLGVCAHAQYNPGVIVQANLGDGQGGINGAGNTLKTAYLHFELWNCGNNVPQVQGNALAIVAQQFDMRPNPTTGVISTYRKNKNRFHEADDSADGNRAKKQKKKCPGSRAKMDGSVSITSFERMKLIRSCRGQSFSTQRRKIGKSGRRNRFQPPYPVHGLTEAVQKWIVAEGFDTKPSPTQPWRMRSFLLIQQYENRCP